MRLKSLKMKNFRNYNYLDVDFSENINIFYGDNAQGKTNILEAIYYASTTKSHKNSKEKELINFNSSESHIELNINKNKLDYFIDMHLKKNNTKGIAINKIPIKKASELLGIIHIIFFSPEDLNIIKNGPSERRKFLDIELSQIDKLYLSDITNYNKIINQRNKLLKESLNNANILDTLDIWDEQLIMYGERIEIKREQFLEKMNVIIKDVHKKLSGGNEKIQIIYDKSSGNLSLREALNKNRERDIKQRNTSIGPHRDDIAFLVNEIDIRIYGSQGQQRTVALSLKLSEIELIKQIINDSPILLLDDVLSELDSSRQHYLLESIKNVQTIITCTGIDDFIKHRFKLDKIFKVVNGKVININ